VTNSEGFEEHLGASGGDPRVTSTWKGRGLLTDRRWMLFVDRADGAPVSKAMAFVAAGVVGIYDVSTRAEARRHGYGSAITAVALAAGKRAGCSAGVLQSSAMARHMYEAQGFRILFRYRAFEARPPDQP
jgi:GNAT superfamily N-acetyltransferase